MTSACTCSPNCLRTTAQRRFAGTETLQPRGAGNLLQPLLDFAVATSVGGHGHFEATLEPAGGGQ